MKSMAGVLLKSCIFVLGNHKMKNGGSSLEKLYLCTWKP